MDSGDEVPTSSSALQRKPPKAAPKHPPTIDMIKEAIRDINEPRKGASVTAIKQWVGQHYPEVDQARFKPLMKKALQKALDEDILMRPAKNTATGALTGRYKIGKAQLDAEKKAEKAAAKKEAGGGRSRAPKTAVNKKIHRRSLSVGAATPKAKKSKSKTHIIPSRRAKSLSPMKTPMKSPKAAKKKPTAAAAKKKAAAGKKKSPAKKASKAKAKSPKAAKTKAAKKSPAKKAAPKAKGKKAAKK